jgi:hypothetical protein
MIIRVQFSSNNLVVSEVSLWDFSSEKEIDVVYILAA